MSGPAPWEMDWSGGEAPAAPRTTRNLSDLVRGQPQGGEPMPWERDWTAADSTFLQRAGKEFARRDAEFTEGVTTGIAGVASLPRTFVDTLQGVGDWAARQVMSEDQWRRVQEKRAAAGPGVSDQLRDQLPAFGDMKAAIIEAPTVVGGAPIRTAEPTDTMGRILRSTGEMIGGAPVAAMMVPNLVGGVAGGVADAMFPESSWVKPAAQIVGGIGAATVQSLRAPPAKLVQDATRNIGPDDWERAARLQAQANAEGVPLLGSEALAPNASAPVAQLAGDVAASRRGGQILSDFAANRVPQMRSAAERMANTVAPAGADPQRIGQAIYGAADDAVRAPQIARANTAQAFFDRARNATLPQSVTDQIVSQIDNAAAQANPTGPVAQTLARIRQGVTAARGNVGQIDEVVKVYDDILKAGAFESGAPIGETIRVNVKPILSGIRETLRNNVDDYARGMEIYSGRADLGASPYTAAVRDVAESRVGNIANSQPGLPALETFKTLAFDPKAGRPAAVRQMFETLGRQNPEAVQQATRNYMEGVIAKSFERLRTGDNPTAGAKLAQAFTGNETTRANITAALRAMPGVTASDAAGRVRGFERLMQVLEATGRTPGIGSPTASRSVTNAAAGSGGIVGGLAETANVMQGSVLAPLARYAREIRAGRSYEQLARILTDPDSVTRLRQLALYGPQTDKARAIAALLLPPLRATQETTSPENAQ